MKKWFGLVLLVGTCAAQQWTVKPEWVKAHEAFLASDVMAGRGSATRDEEIAATYVASEFEGYGLTHAPGMSEYLQAAEVVAPVLDGRATLMVGGVTLTEGSEFVLMSSPGVGVSGPLVEVAATEVGKTPVPKGAVVLVTGSPSRGSILQVVNPLWRAGASAVLLEESESTRQMYAARGGKTQVRIRLKDAAPRTTGSTLVAVSPEAVARLRKITGVATLAVHEMPSAAPRRTFNAVGYLAGTDGGAGTILLSAHLDHLGVGKPVNGDSIYNGANDDAAGTTAVLELAHALAAGPRLRRSVLFVCYGSEETGGLGSTFFGAHPPVPLKDLVTNLEFEMIGTQDPKMPKGTLLLTGWERSNLGPTLKAHGALLGPDPYPEEHFFERSDNYSLALLGVVAHTAAGWGTPPTYHQPSDDLAHLNVEFMTAAIQSLVEPVRWLAGSDFKPQWNAGGQPTR